MRGLYTEKVVSGKIPFGQLMGEILYCDNRDIIPEDMTREGITPGDISAEQFCDDGEGEVNNGRRQILCAEKV